MKLSDEETEQRKYEEKMKREELWHENYHFETSHVLNSRLFYSPERTFYNYDFPKKQLLLAIKQALGKSQTTNPSILVAPLGVGQDVSYLMTISNQISGIDISVHAIKEAQTNYNSVKTYIGDIRDMHMFPDNHFDIVVMPLFFHHFVDFGFDVFLKEGHRVAKPGGYLFSLEPVIFHPISYLAVLARKVFGNITGIQPDERPILPSMLTKSMKRNNFKEISVYGAGFSHTRWPIWTAKIINVVTRPILRLPVIKYFAFMCIFQGKK
jgi:ubiquinone/menaquinone biosynthesis C-methylase UbiE